LVSPLRANFHKSQIDIIGVDEDVVYSYLMILNCNHMLIPFKYFEMTIGETQKEYNLETYH